MACCVQNATLVQELSDRAATHTEELQRALSDATAAAAAGQAKLHDTEQQAATAAAIASQEYADQQQCLTAQIQQAKRAAQLKGKAMDELVAQHAEQLGQLHITQQQLQQQVLEHTNQLQQELSVHDEAKTCLGQLQADHDTLKASHSLMLQEAEALNKSKFDLSAKLQQQESANDTISDQMENMKTEQQTSQAIIHSMQEQVAKHKEASSQTQQQITELQSNAAELQQQLAARPKQADLDSIISERDNLQLQLSGRSVINKQLEEVNTQYAAAQKQLQEHDSLRKQLDMLQEQLQERDDAVMQLQHLPADLDEAVLQAKQITAERDAALSEITKLHKQLSEAASQDVMDQLESLTETAERQVQEYQQEHAQLLQQFQADFAKAQAEHQDMYRSQLQEYQAVADSKQADAEQAQELLSDKAAEVSTLQQQLRQQSHDLQASCEKLAQAEIDHLQHAQHLREELSTTMQDRYSLNLPTHAGSSSRLFKVVCAKLQIESPYGSSLELQAYASKV